MKTRVPERSAAPADDRPVAPRPADERSPAATEPPPYRKPAVRLQGQIQPSLQLGSPPPPP